MNNIKICSLILISSLIFGCASGGGEVGSKNNRPDKVVDSSIVLAKDMTVKKSFSALDAVKVAASEAILKGFDADAIAAEMKRLNLKDAKLTAYNSAKNSYNTADKLYKTVEQNKKDSVTALFGFCDTLIALNAPSDNALVGALVIAKNSGDVNVALAALKGAGKSHISMTNYETAKTAFETVTLNKDAANVKVTVASTDLKSYAAGLNLSVVAPNNSGLHKTLTLADLKLKGAGGYVNDDVVYVYTNGKVSGIKITVEKSLGDKKTIDFKSDSFSVVDKKLIGKISATVNGYYKLDADSKMITKNLQEYNKLTDDEKKEYKKFTKQDKSEIALLGASVNLSYSDFGYFKTSGGSKDADGKVLDPVWMKNSVFVGGYADKAFNKNDIAADMVFTGKAVGVVENTTTGKSDIILGVAALNFKKADKSESLDIKFDGWYDMSFKGGNVNISEGAGYKEKGDLKFTAGSGKTGAGLNTVYYGNSKMNPTEASGSFKYYEGNVKLDGVFGVKK